MERTITTVSGGVLEVPELDPSDPLSAELDEAYFALARGKAGAEARISAIEQKIVERETAKRRETEMARREAAHQRRLNEAQAAVEQAEAQRKARIARVVLRPLWGELDAAAGSFAKVAARIMQTAITDANESPHAQVIEVLRTAIFKETDGVIQRRLLVDIGRPLPQNRQLETHATSILESE